MKNEQLNKKVVNATKWSSITQIVAKIITPLTNMVLARILAPEAFGVIVTVTMVISFAEMFTDSGFQKYLIQQEFENIKHKYNSANVAFWTNFGLALSIWGIIILFNKEIANIVGSPGLGHVIIIACIQLPLTSFSSIQMALYRRKFDFKTLFVVRIIGILIPFIVTIPLALIGYDYWSLIIGMICMQAFNAVFLTIKSTWKPRFFYDKKLLTEMFSFSMWSLLEAVSIWLTLWLDAFIIGSFLSDYHLGIYRTSTSMVNALMALVTASVVPVLFSTLSRLQNNDHEFRHAFYKFQRIVAYLVLPMGVGVFLYSDLATSIMLGNQWKEASNVIGIWALTSSVLIVTSHFNSEVYRSKGKPKLSLVSQLITLSFLVPTCLISVQHGFWTLVYARALIRFQGVITGFIIMSLIMKFPVIRTVKNLYIPVLLTGLMTLLAILLKQISESILWSFISIITCVYVYFSLFFLIAKEDSHFLRNLIKR